MVLAVACTGPGTNQESRFKIIMQRKSESLKAQSFVFLKGEVFFFYVHILD